MFQSNWIQNHSKTSQNIVPPIRTPRLMNFQTMISAFCAASCSGFSYVYCFLILQDKLFLQEIVGVRFQSLCFMQLHGQLQSCHSAVVLGAFFDQITTMEIPACTFLARHLFMFHQLLFMYGPYGSYIDDHWCIYTVHIFHTCSRIDSWSNLRESLFDHYLLVLVLGALRWGLPSWCLCLWACLGVDSCW